MRSKLTWNPSYGWKSCSFTLFERQLKRYIRIYIFFLSTISCVLFFYPSYSSTVSTFSDACSSVYDVTSSLSSPTSTILVFFFFMAPNWDLILIKYDNTNFHYLLIQAQNLNNRNKKYKFRIHLFLRLLLHFLLKLQLFRFFFFVMEFNWDLIQTICQQSKCLLPTNQLLVKVFNHQTSNTSYTFRFQYSHVNDDMTIQSHCGGLPSLTQTTHTLSDKLIASSRIVHSLWS